MAEPGDALDAFLRVHAAREGVPSRLYAGGEALWQQLRGRPPADRRWGAFLAAMGETACERLGDDTSAAAWFRRCLEAEPVHRDPEACTVAGYGQGVLWERSGDASRALPAYRAAAGEGFRCASITPATLRAATAAVRVGFDCHGRLDPGDAALAKQAWLGWTWLAEASPAAIDDRTAEELGRILCAFLLPEDDPGLLAGAWRGWAPHHVATGSGPWRDDDPRCLHRLFLAAAAAADRFLADEGPARGAPYRMLAAACLPLRASSGDPAANA